MTIKEIVIREFSEPQVQERYEKLTREGLWNSEKIMYQKYFKLGSTILDMGCGSGRTSFSLNKLGYKVVGRDLTPAMITTAKKLAKEFKAVIDFKVGDATALEFKDQSFDNGIFSFCGWDQIPRYANRQKAIDEMYRVLKPGGHYIFTTHIREVGTFGKWIPFWVKQAIKMYLLKPLGFNVQEEEWGDRFFKREGAEGNRVTCTKYQYTHIPSRKEVEKQITDAGFEIAYTELKGVIGGMEDLNSTNPRFYVCKKPN